MTIVSLRRYLSVALPLVGSAILLYSCKAEQSVEQEQVNPETLMTEYSEDLSIQMSENGLKSYHFSTPLMEGYAMARDPYKEFRKGIKVVMYEDDSTANVSATMTSNYAIFYDNRKLWEAKGDVVVIQTNGRKLYTQQLFWNQATHRIYSNVDSRVVDGDEVYDCEGFESDENMTDWRYRKLKGVTYFTDPESTPDEGRKEGVNDKSKVDKGGEQVKSRNQQNATQPVTMRSTSRSIKSSDATKMEKREFRGGTKYEQKKLDKKAMPIAKPQLDDKLSR